jgi:hypothetical protein
VVAALSSTASCSNVWKDQDLVHRIQKGTSQAAAHTAGALALLLEGDPGLNPAEARAWLADHARADQYTGAVPNGVYGRGKLHLTSGSTSVLEVPPSRLGFRAPYPNPTMGPAHFEFSLDAETVEGSEGRVELQIFDVTGRQVQTLRGRWVEGPQHLVWDGTTRVGTRAPAGFYVARLLAGRVGAIQKLVRLPQ